MLDTRDFSFQILSGNLGFQKRSAGVGILLSRSCMIVYSDHTFVPVFKNFFIVEEHSDIYMCRFFLSSCDYFGAFVDCEMSMDILQRLFYAVILLTFGSIPRPKPG